MIHLFQLCFIINRQQFLLFEKNIFKQIVTQSTARKQLGIQIDLKMMLFSDSVFNTDELLSMISSLSEKP